MPTDVTDSVRLAYPHAIHMCEKTKVKILTASSCREFRRYSRILNHFFYSGCQERGFNRTIKTSLTQHKAEIPYFVLPGVRDCGVCKPILAGIQDGGEKEGTYNIILYGVDK